MPRALIREEQEDQEVREREPGGDGFMACLQTQLYALVNPVADSIAQLAMQKDFMLLSCNHHNHIEITCQVQLFCIQNTLSSSCDRCLKKKAER